MASTISFSGLASGIDTDALIKASSEATRSVKVTPKEEKITELESTDDAFDDLKAKLNALRTILSDFTTAEGNALSKTASSSDETVFTASAAGSAANGTYELTVTQLARNATQSFGRSGTAYSSSSAKIAETINNGDPAADRTVTMEIGSGTGKETIAIEITNTTTLNEFATAFNEKAKNALATVVNVGTSSSPDYRVLVSSNNTGTTKGTITTTIGTSVTGASGFNLPGGLSQAQDAVFSVGGIAGTITRSTNTITDLIPSVTFNLKSEGGPATCIISDDTSATSQKIQEFVDAFNDIIQYVNENNNITREEDDSNNVTNTFGTLAKTSLDQNIVTSLKGALSSASYSSGTAVKIFADLGITTDYGTYDSDKKTGGGTLLFDTEDFAAALAKEPQSVAAVLQKFADATATTSGIIYQYTKYNGLIDITVNGNKELVSDLNDQISEAEKQISENETAMKSRFARLESLMSELQSKQTSLTSALSGLG